MMVMPYAKAVSAKGNRIQIGSTLKYVAIPEQTPPKILRRSSRNNCRGDVKVFCSLPVDVSEEDEVPCDDAPGPDVCVNSCSSAALKSLTLPIVAISEV